MEEAYVPLLILVTSASAYLWSRYRWHTDCRSVKLAFWLAMEQVGCWLIVYLANLTIGAAIILIVRWVGNYFISFYTLGSLMLFVLSLFQALWIYHLWSQRD